MIYIFSCKVWTLTLCVKHYIIKMTSKCCKHWFFCGNFRPLFDTYWVVSHSLFDECWFLSVQELKVYLHKHGFLFVKLLSTTCCSSTKCTYLRREWSSGFICCISWTVEGDWHIRQQSKALNFLILFFKNKKCWK